MHVVERVAHGDGRAIWELQRNGFLRDALRSFALALLGVGLAVLAVQLPWSSFAHARIVSLAVLAGGIAAALGGAIRSAGPGIRRRWLAVGLATGMIVVLAQ